jgi:hypothetical protein
MSQSNPSPLASAPSSEADRSPAAPLFSWLVIQVLALSVAVFRLPLSARFPLPGEQFAIHIMLATQVIASAMLFPFLMRDVATSAMVILAIVPFVQLASYLSDVSVSRAGLAALFVATWMSSLAFWRLMLPTHRRAMLGVACAVALSVGGAILWYVHAESREVAMIDWPRDALFGPVLGVVAQIEATPPPVASWVETLALLGVGAIIFAATRKRAPSAH